MNLHVHGDSIGSLSEYYLRKIIDIKEKIDEKGEELANRDIEELTDFFIQDAVLPTIEKDSSRSRTMKKEENINLRGRKMLVNVNIPIILKEKIDQVIGRRSRTYIQGQNNFALNNDNVVVDIWVNENSENATKTIENEIGQIDKVIDYKNEHVKSGNKILKSEIKQYLEQKQQKLEKENSLLNEVSKKLKIELIKKNVSIIDLDIKKQIKILMPSQQEKKSEPQLEQETVNTVIEIIQQHCRQFEITPEAFEGMKEELLRDQILGMLNVVFEGDATGESFVKSGKTDIKLKTNVEGGILSGECKFWVGQKLYQETIDQHFNYLTWSQNYAIQITFSRKKKFSEVLENAKKAAMEHETYIENSFKEIDKQHFVTKHRFKNDSNKIVEVHHIIVDLSTNNLN